MRFIAVKAILADLWFERNQIIFHDYVRDQLEIYEVISRILEG